MFCLKLPHAVRMQHVIKRDPKQILSRVAEMSLTAETANKKLVLQFCQNYLQSLTLRTILLEMEWTGKNQVLITTGRCLGAKISIKK